MRIEHIALWTHDLERSREFYTTYFDATANEKYTNTRKQFQSYFLTFASGARLELMQRPDIGPPVSQEISGWAHIAISLESEAAVNALTERLRADGYTIAGEPRTTGDGYYESVILDPDGNRVELTV